MDSKKPSKQRKAFHKMSLHKRIKYVSGHLAKELRSKFGKRSVSLRKGDKVKVMVGTFKNKEGKISDVDYRKRLIYVEGIVKKKSDGSEFMVGLNPSNVLVMDVVEKDERRFKDKKIVKKKTKGEKE